MYSFSQFGPPIVALPAEILQRGLSDPAVKKYYELMLLVAMEFKSYSSVLASLLSVLPFAWRMDQVQEMLQFEISLARVRAMTRDKIRTDKFSAS